LNDGIYGEGLLVPGTVNAESDIVIDSLARLDSNDDPMTFQIGDCFEIKFNFIATYEAHLAGHYIPVKNAITECALNVAATCEKIDGYMVKVTLQGSTDNLNGKIGKIQNPYSQVDLPLKQINYYQSCVEGAPTDSMDTEDSPVSFEIGSIPSVKFETSTKIVGYSGTDNVATFTFTPATSISPVGGEVHIEAKAWYVSKRTKSYPMQETGFECTSTSFTEVTA